MALIFEKKCTICGRKFCPSAEWVYKRGSNHGYADKMFCSYACMKKYDRILEERARKMREKRKMGKTKVTFDDIAKRKEAIAQMLDKGLNLQQIAETLGVSTTCVRYYRDEINIDRNGEV